MADPCPRRTPAVAAVIPALALAVAGCGAGAEPVAAPSTVTVTASVAPPDDAAATAAPASQAPSEAPSEAPSSAAASAEPSVDLAALPRQERGFDVAYVTGTSTAGGGTVLAIDRLTVAGLDDDTLSEQGTPVFVDEGEQFSNQTVRSYEVGVSPDARFFLTTCSRDDSGPRISSEPVDLDTFLAAPGLDGTAVTFAYADGLVVRGETNPRC